MAHQCPWFAKVKYESVYPAIDLVFYGNREGNLEYDFIVAPGGDPQQIVLAVEGAESVVVDSSGELHITAATGTIRKPAPHVYQEIAGKRREITAAYRLLNPSDESDSRLASLKQHRVAFGLGAYDRSRPLVIDPQILYATYLGGSSNTTIAPEGAFGVAVDAQGAAYIVGTTVSAAFPTKSPLQGILRGNSNAFVTKLDANGQLVYSTYLGGSFYDSGEAIKVDGTGAVYVGGSTNSSDFPTVNAFQGTNRGVDAFLTKLSPGGDHIVYSTYFGGSDDESVTALALDTQNNLYVVGNIRTGLVPATNFPTVNPIQSAHGGGFRDGFVSLLSSDGSTLLFSTYLGGDGDDWFQATKVDPVNGHVFLGYHTNSTNFPPPSNAASPAALPSADTSRPGAQVIDWDPVRLKLVWTVAASDDLLSPDGTIKFADGTENPLTSAAIGIARLSPPIIGPSPQTPEVVTRAGGGLDIKLVVMDQNLNIAKSVYFGGSNEETLNAMAGDTRGAIYVLGNTRSTNLPTVNPIQPNRSDGFLAVFHPQTLQPVFSTYLGGIGNFQQFLSGVTVDPQGSIYVVGETFSNDFPTATVGAVQNQLRGRSDAFIIKISPVTIPQPAAVDFDNDGKSDILWRHSSGNVYVWFLNGTSVVGNGSVGSASTDSTIAGIGDFYGDGKSDILWRHTSGSTFIWLLNGTSVIGDGSPGPASTDWTIAGIGDFNGDGRSDILWRHTSGSTFIWLLNGASVSATAPRAASADWTIAGVGNFNGDGNSDILWRHTSAAPSSGSLTDVCHRRRLPWFHQHRLDHRRCRRF